MRHFVIGSMIVLVLGAPVLAKTDQEAFGKLIGVRFRASRAEGGGREGECLIRL